MYIYIYICMNHTRARAHVIHACMNFKSKKLINSVNLRHKH